MSGNTSSANVPDMKFFIDSFQSWPIEAQIGITAAFLLWMIGGNIIILSSMRRRGISFWKILLPSFTIFTGMNKSERLALLSLGILAMVMGNWGVSLIA